MPDIRYKLSKYCCVSVTATDDVYSAVMRDAPDPRGDLGAIRAIATGPSPNTHEDVLRHLLRLAFILQDLYPNSKDQSRIPLIQDAKRMMVILIDPSQKLFVWQVRRVQSGSPRSFDVFTQDGQLWMRQAVCVPPL